MKTFCLLAALVVAAVAYDVSGQPPSFNMPQVQPRPGPFVRPPPQPGYAGVMTLPERIPEDLSWRTRPGRDSWTRPALRPDVPPFQRPQIQPPHPGFVPQGEREICQDCSNLTFKRKGACCRRWNLCC